MKAADEFDVHPEMAALIAAKRDVPVTMDPAAMREAWNAYGARTRVAYPEGMAVRDASVPCPPRGPDAEMAVRIYTPAAAAPAGPCIVYLHGGAFVKGSLDSGDGVAWAISETTGVTVVSADYRLAPDHPYPAAVEDCHALLTHLAAHGANLGVDGSRIVLWGDSAGGNLAAASCLVARDRGGPMILGAAINYGCLTDELTSASYRDYADSPGLKTASMDRCWSYYLGDGRPTAHAYAAPLKAPDLSGLPPMHVHYAEIDPLADDSVRFAERLEAAGSPVRLRCARRMIHGFHRARQDGPDAAAEFAAACGFLVEMLGV